ncbi:glutathione peroxidase [Arenibacterium sp. CAU 1754]
MTRLLLVLFLTVAAQMAPAKDIGGTFASIDGGTLAIEQWRGQPILVVNTASQCGFTGQYEGLQKVYDRYRDRGLVVLAVPSNDFRQELGSAEEVKEFCELTYGLDIPMTDITHVRGSDAHPFFKAVKQETGFEPGWNFNKVLIGPDGGVVATWGSVTKPESRVITKQIEALLN